MRNFLILWQMSMMVSNIQTSVVCRFDGNIAYDFAFGMRVWLR